MEECGVKRAKAIKMIKERRGKFVKECEIYFSNGDLNCKPKTVGKQKMDTALSFENLNIISKRATPDQLMRYKLSLCVHKL